MRHKPVHLLITAASTLAAVVLTQSHVNGQTLHQSIAELSPFVGQWVGPIDAYGDRPAGSLRVECEPICDGIYLNIKVSYTPQGSSARSNVENILIGFNPQTKSRHVWSFTKLAQAHTNIKVDTSRLTMKNLTYPLVDGSQSVRTVEYQLDNDNQFTVQITNVREAGADRPDWPIIVLRPTR